MFENALKLDRRVAIYVPGTVDTDKPDAITAAALAKDVARELSELFGGATVTPASGAWISDVAGLVMEDVRIVYSYTTSDAIRANAAQIENIVARVKRDMRQEAVSVEIDGTLYIA